MPSTQPSIQHNKPNRCVIIMDETLKGGHLANAIAVIALTAGQRHPGLVGEPLIDASEIVHPGLIPTGIPMLCARQECFGDLRIEALQNGCDVVDFPVIGQQTKNYREFQETMSTIRTEDLQYTGIAIIGDRKQVGRIVRDLHLIQ
jgi:hypothetical protein